MPKKRGNNEGSIRQRKDGTWEGRYVAGYKADGKTNRKSVFGKTQKEVQVKIRETLRQLDRREYVESSRITVEQWLDTWYGLYVANNLKPSTAVSYRNICDYYLKTSIGSLKLQALRQENVQAMVNELNLRKLKPATVKKVYMVLKTALQRAVRNQMLISNPALYTILPKLNQDEIQFLTRNEQQELLDALPDSANGRALRFILGTGLRASELIGLRWSDIHGDCLTVSQTIQRRGDLEKGKGTCIYFGTPKSKAGHRTVPLTAKMEDLLRVHKRLQRARRLQIGAVWQDNDLIFCTEMGTPNNDRNIARTLDAALKNAGLAHRGLHALRHSFATRAVENGMDIRTLSEILGHADVATTLRLYVHTSIDTKREAMRGMDRVL